MAPTPPTVIATKQDFLAAQTRLLSQPLNPSRTWRTTNSSHEEALPNKAIDDALFKLNHQLTQHSRRVFAPQATRHVAEQIEQLYWNAAVAATGGDGDGEDEDAGEMWGLMFGADLVDGDIIASLPSAWDTVSPQQAEAHPLEAKRYAEMVGQLQELASRRKASLARIARLVRMKALLEPFEEVEAVQENLVTRNGEVENELTRMRVLLARVGGRVSQLREREEAKGAGDDEMVVDGECDEQRKVGLLLERF